jgi:hypothetical protein
MLARWRGMERLRLRWQEQQAARRAKTGCKTGGRCDACGASCRAPLLRCVRRPQLHRFVCGAQRAAAPTPLRSGAFLLLHARCTPPFAIASLRSSVQTDAGASAGQGSGHGTCASQLCCSQTGWGPRSAASAREQASCIRPSLPPPPKRGQPARHAPAAAARTPQASAAATRPPRRRRPACRPLPQRPNVPCRAARPRPPPRPPQLGPLQPPAASASRAGGQEGGGQEEGGKGGPCPCSPPAMPAWRQPALRAGPGGRRQARSQISPEPRRPLNIAPAPQSPRTTATSRPPARPLVPCSLAAPPIPPQHLSSRAAACQDEGRPAQHRG